MKNKKKRRFFFPVSPAKRFLAAVLALVCLGSLCACGGGTAAGPESLSILLEGEEVNLVELMAGSELSGLSAELSPAGYDGEVMWSSEDSGIVKVVPVDDGVTLVGKKSGSTRITAECGGVSCAVRVHVLADPENPSALETALTVMGTPYSAAMVNLYYAQSYYSFLEQYGSYAAYYGLDSSTGIATLADQECSSSSDGTWRGYFLEAAETTMLQVAVLCRYAEENGITLTEEDEQQVSEQLALVRTDAEESGYESLEAYLQAYYGSGVNESMYLTTLERNALADRAYTAYQEGLTYTDEELDAHFAELGYDDSEDYSVPLTSMRHILVMAEADEDGNYSKAAISAAHARAKEIYDEWKAGEQTEESFAALAEQYSEDSGSNTNGGLYTDIYPGQMVEGIDSWLFSSKRAAGDTTLVDNNGSYVGSHVVFYVGSGELYSRALARSDLLSSALNDWFTELTADTSVEEGPAISSVGSF